MVSLNKPKLGDIRFRHKGLFRKRLILQHWTEWDDDGMTCGKWEDTQVEDLSWLGPIIAPYATKEIEE